MGTKFWIWAVPTSRWAMVFVRVKRIRGQEYVYEVENYRDRDGAVRQRVVRYVGVRDPAYGRPPVDLDQARKALARRLRERRDADTS